ncbi:ImmunoGlobulin-like Cell adhesion Molecule family [Dirofilaria immitis]|nr:ImmunoGlobulin-like Cell adhesion Molecule family [Dirofilaria immitis]
MMVMMMMMMTMTTMMMLILSVMLNRPYLFIIFIFQPISGQLAQGGGVKVKISDMPFPVPNAQQLNQIVWTMLGTATKETIYCVSEAPVSQLRFVCVDCYQKNITDMVNVLSSAQDLTRSAGFPTVALRGIAVNTNWTGATIMCQAALNGGTIDSAPAVIDVRYLKQPHVVDTSGQGPILIASQGYRFYVECIRTSEGLCQQSGRRKTLRCAVQSHPPATVFRWLKNGIVISGNGADITIGTEMIGQSIQCSANNASARLVQDNFQTMQNAAPFQTGNRIDMNQQINLGCQVEGNPRPVVFWKLRKSNGQVVDAACPQGFEGQYQEVPLEQRGQAPYATNIRLNAICSLRIANYTFSGQYWCAACSFVSQGAPECSPSLDSPGTTYLNVQVQGPPTQSDALPSVQKLPRDVIFSVDQNELQIGQTWQNFRFESTTQNNTVPNCHLAKLLISPVSDSDTNRQVVLKVQNTYGSKHITVPLGALFGGHSAAMSSFPNWLMILLMITVFGVSISLLMIMRETYREDGPRSLYQTSGQPAEVIRSESRTDSAYHLYLSKEACPLDYESAVQAAYCDSRMSSV